MPTLIKEKLEPAILDRMKVPISISDITSKVITHS